LVVNVWALVELFEILPFDEVLFSMLPNPLMMSDLAQWGLRRVHCLVPPEMLNTFFG
jgi:hypothetical protein